MKEVYVACRTSSRVERRMLSNMKDAFLCYIKERLDSVANKVKIKVLA